jgi:hypothetical protein
MLAKEPVASPEERAHVEVVSVPAGLSVLRYISAEDTTAPPTVRVVPRSAGRRLDFIPVPGEAEHVLRAPGAAIVLVANAETELVVTAIRPPGSSSAAVNLHLELLAGAMSSHVREARGEGRDVGTSRPHLSRVSVLGHVARQGDVLVASGEWLGGPEFPIRIEGLEVRWPDMPDDLQLEYSVVIGGSALHSLPACRVNEFAGTKGRAAPIVRLTMALHGETASSYRIKADCLFLGGQMISESGQTIILSGPTGREPLVGLRMWIETTSGFRTAKDSTPFATGGRRVTGSTAARRKSQ